MTKYEQERDQNRDQNRDQDRGNRNDRGHDNDNDNGERAIAPAPKGDLLASTALQALQTTFNNVDTTPIGGHSGRPLLQFRSREDNGIWCFGQKRTRVEEGSLWAFNPASFKWGWICFSEANKRLGERMVSISQPKPDITELPDKGAEWQEQMTVDLKCVDGTDATVEVTFVSTTIGGNQALCGLIETIRDRLNSNQHGRKIVPVVRLEKSSYQHSQYGRVWTPVLTVVDWMLWGGPGGGGGGGGGESYSPPAEQSPAEQPRRRRVT
jgi:hypothetical protein